MIAQSRTGRSPCVRKKCRMFVAGESIHVYVEKIKNFFIALTAIPARPPKRAGGMRERNVNFSFDAIHAIVVIGITRNKNVYIII